MEILDHLLEHDAAATRSQLTFCRGLSNTQWHATFDFGQGSLYDTFDHLIDSKEYWTSLMQGQAGPFSPPPADPERGLESLMRRNDAISETFLALSRLIRDEDRLGGMFVDMETGPARRTYGGCIIHVATHSMHHRAQVRIMFDLLGVSYDPFDGFAMDWYALDAQG